ncbi:MAG: hypothetical protein MZV64_49995 [Ignavibacteriales bacterium]|nr:hypothetical protein [Ignavibacteriales bacterium]
MRGRNGGSRGRDRHHGRTSAGSGITPRIIGVRALPRNRRPRLWSPGGEPFPDRFRHILCAGSEMTRWLLRITGRTVSGTGSILNEGRRT